MRNGRSDKALPFGPLDIHVNPLLIVGAIRELTDARLVDGQPLGDAQGTPDELRDGSKAVSAGHHGGRSPDPRIVDATRQPRARGPSLTRRVGATRPT